MTIADLPWDGASPAVRNGAKGLKPCRHPRAYRHHEMQNGIALTEGATCCWACLAIIEPRASRRGRANRSRGNRAELAVARMIPGARKMGPLGLPWDVEVGTYARLQVKKLVSRPSLAEIARLIRAIPDTGDRLRGFVWVEAAGRGKRGEVRVWFLGSDFQAWHGLGSQVTSLISMPLAEWVAEFVEEPR